VRVAVIGAGVTGLTAARRLALGGAEVDVYERWPGLGGQAATVELASGGRVERYYHHWFTSDRHIVDLCSELGVDVEWLESSVAFFAEGALHPFTTPMDLLRFKPVPFLSRIRMGLAVLSLQRRHREVEPFEGMTAHMWVHEQMGAEAWRHVWGPLLRGKFGDRSEDVSMAWLHGKLLQRRQVKGAEARREVLGYPRDSFEPIFVALREEIEGAGGRVFTDRPVATLDARDGGGFTLRPGEPGSWRTGHDPAGFDRAAEPEGYDTVLATVPNDVFGAILDPGLAAALPAGYRQRLDSITYHSALCLLLELDHSFTQTYWINIADDEMPFVGLVEHTNLVSPERYGGAHLLYVANYVAPGDPLLDLGAERLLDVYEPHLRRISPAFDRAGVRKAWRFAEPAAQPIVDIGYRERIPPLRTGIEGLVLANTTQVYPEDRGTSYAVRLGEQAAALLAGAPVTA
jgi:protoporphyrinogen oxidase